MGGRHRSCDARAVTSPEADDRARIPLQVALVMLVLIVVAGVRASVELAAGGVLRWVFVVGFGGLTVAVAAVYVRMERSRAG